MTDTAEVEAVARALCNYERDILDTPCIFPACGCSATQARAAIAALDAVRGWRPIETAPKDRTQFLGWVPAFEKVGRDGKPQGPPNVQICWWDTSVITFKPRIMILGMGDFLPEKFAPTHWMPLPPAPEDAS